MKRPLVLAFWFLRNFVLVAVILAILPFMVVGTCVMVPVDWIRNRIGANRYKELIASGQVWTREFDDDKE